MSRLLPAMLCAIALGASFATTPAYAGPTLRAAVLHISREWARIKYDVHGDDQQMKQLRPLERQAAALAKRYPKHATPLLWQGIVASEEAARAGLFHKLGYAEKARRLFDEAKALHPDAGHGGVWLSLGVLYSRVPGFPFGFGSDSKARRYLRRALAIDPDGLDANYFYGDFLFSEGKYAQARKVLERGLQAPVDARRPIWNKGRRLEIRALIARIRRKERR